MLGGELAADSAYLFAKNHGFIDDFLAETGMPCEEVSMFYPMPVDSLEAAQNPAVVLLAGSDGGKVSGSSSEIGVMQMGVCLAVFHNKTSAVSPLLDVLTYLDKFDSDSGEYYRRNIENAKVQISFAKHPAHGEVLPGYPGASFEELIRLEGKYGYYSYYSPDENFEGKDNFVVEVVVDGMIFNVLYYVYIGGPDENPRLNCGVEIPEFWKISLANNVESTASIDALRSRLGIPSGLDVQFAGLTDASLGQTSGIGLGSTITLDPAAAGHGWFIDATPTDNEEFLPTADPSVWMAKPGSAAEGKMDMLTVLLHEYGHVLGLEHSADGADGMAATLKPGGRLWSAGDLAALARLGVSYVQNADGSLTLASA